MAAWQWAGVYLAVGLLAARVEAGITLPSHDFDTLTVERESSFPYGIVVTPDGTVWFSAAQQDYIGRYTLSGGFAEELRLPSPGLPQSPGFMTQGGDGNLWFTETNSNAIGRITPTGTITEFPIPSAFTTPNDITRGPDGNVWFTARSPSRGVDFGRIGRITPSGTISEFPIDQVPVGITRGPDNALWFTTRGNRVNGPAGGLIPIPGGIGRIATNGQSTIEPVDGEPVGITTGPDGALWFTNDFGDYVIGRYSTDGQLTKFALPTFPTGGEPFQLSPLRIVRGPEDNLWFTTFSGGIWRINQAGTMDEILFFGQDNFPQDITTGTDGRLWFTLSFGNAIGHVDALAFTNLNIADGGPLDLTRAADDSIWFVDAVRPGIGRIGPEGGVVQFELGDGFFPTAVAIATDGTAWFTNIEKDTIGHLTAEGEVVEFLIPSPPSNPQEIVLGPDGNLWFTELDAGSLGRITSQGVIRRFPIEPEDRNAGPRGLAELSAPQDLTVGPDGNLWFTDPGLNAIGRMTTSGAVVTFPIPTAGADPSGIAAGPDGHLYFTEAGPGRIARITTAGVITELGTPDPDSFPLYITAGPDGAIWWTESDTNRLGRLAPDGRITKFDLDPNTYPAGIVGRSDGRLFVALLNAARIDYTYLAASEPTRTATPIPSQTRTPTRTRTVPPGSTVTSTPTVTETVPPGSTVTSTPTVTETVPPDSTPTETSEPTENPTETIGCHGDCDGGGDVSINELIVAVNIALGNADNSACVHADADGSGEVQINDLIAAVNAALQGCAG